MELRDRILDKAAELFFQEGVKSVTMTDVAKHLGISKRTLYEQFKDKDELVSKC
ncbi:MAG: TetR/AcrR family transcriptional regulator, partial [Tannerellaceae bacterium]